MAEDKKASKDAASKDGAPKRDKSKLLLIIIIVVLLVVLLAGGAVAFFMMRNSSGVDTAVDDGSDAVHQTKRGKKKGEHPPIFQKLSQFTVNLNTPDGDQAMLQTDIVVEVADDKTEEDLKGVLPKVQNEVNKLLRSKTPADVRAANSTDKLGAEIRIAINKILGYHPEDEGVGVLSVNFTTFIVQ